MYFPPSLLSSKHPGPHSLIALTNKPPRSVRQGPTYIIANSPSEHPGNLAPNNTFGSMNSQPCRLYHFSRPAINSIGGHVDENVEQAPVIVPFLGQQTLVRSEHGNAWGPDVNFSAHMEPPWPKSSGRNNRFLHFAERIPSLFPINGNCHVYALFV